MHTKNGTEPQFVFLRLALWCDSVYFHVENNHWVSGRRWQGGGTSLGVARRRSRLPSWRDYAGAPAGLLTKHRSQAGCRCHGGDSQPRSGLSAHHRCPRSFVDQRPAGHLHQKRDPVKEYGPFSMRLRRCVTRPPCRSSSWPRARPHGAILEELLEATFERRDGCDRPGGMLDKVAQTARHAGQMQSLSVAVLRGGRSFYSDVENGSARRS